MRTLVIAGILIGCGAAQADAFSGGAYSCTATDEITFDKTQTRDARKFTFQLLLRGRVVTISGREVEADDFVVRLNRSDYLRATNKNGLLAIVGAKFALSYIFPTRGGIKTYTLLADCRK